MKKDPEEDWYRKHEREQEEREEHFAAVIRAQQEASARAAEEEAAKELAEIMADQEATLAEEAAAKEPVRCPECGYADPCFGQASRCPICDHPFEGTGYAWFNLAVAV